MRRGLRVKTRLSCAEVSSSQSATAILLSEGKELVGASRRERIGWAFDRPPRAVPAVSETPPECRFQRSHQRAGRVKGVKKVISSQLGFDHFDCRFRPVELARGSPLLLIGDMAPVILWIQLKATIAVPPQGGL
jgi:hypothetical protein